MADELQAIPGIGPSMAKDLRDLGIFELTDLRGQDPEMMYKRLCLIHDMHIDRCVLYVFRCAATKAQKPADPSSRTSRSAAAGSTRVRSYIRIPVAPLSIPIQTY